MKAWERMHSEVDLDDKRRKNRSSSGERGNHFSAGDSTLRLQKENDKVDSIKQEKLKSLRGEITPYRYNKFIRKAKETYEYDNFDVIQRDAEKDAKDTHDHYEVTHHVMRGKVCLLTGATSGIGKVTALELAKRGAEVVVVGRNRDKCEKTVNEIQAQTDNRAVKYLVADLSSQNEVRRLAQEFKQGHDRLDVLVNNAGITLFQRESGDDEIEKTFATNHLGPFMLTNLLSDKLKKSDAARIVNVSSIAHNWATFDADLDAQKAQAPSGPKAYYASKLANVLFTKELARRLEGTKITVNALNPGYVKTNIGKADGSIIGKIVMPIANRWYQAVSPEKGAETSVYLATSPEVKDVSGKYFEEMKEIPSSQQTYDQALAERLWDISRQMTKMSEDEVVPIHEEKLKRLEEKFGAGGQADMTEEEIDDLRNLINNRSDKDKDKSTYLKRKKDQEGQLEFIEQKEFQALKRRIKLRNLL